MGGFDGTRSLLLSLALIGAVAALADEPRKTEAPGASDIRIALGRRLFYDADLSINGTMSCATCHEQWHGFTDNNRSHPGALGHLGKRNVPGLANVAFLRNQTWADNSLGSLERQARNPILGTQPIEMGVGGHEAEAIARFANNPCYVRLFAAAFPERDGKIDLDSIALAIASFERTLIALDSPYDRALRAGLPLADPLAETGRRLFTDRGCADCHRPPYFTDDDFHRVRALQPGERDAGLSDVTGRNEDRGRFRTPPLHNVAVTFPYWHDGRAATLADAIALHERAPTGAAAPSPEDIEAIVAFLHTLTDKGFLEDERFSLPPAACPAID